MKTPKKQLRPIALLMAIAMVIQSCTVYKSTPLTLEQAVQNESKVRITSNSNESFKYKKIVFEDGKYYGVKRFTREKFRVHINEDLVKSIDEINITQTTVLNIGIPLAIIGVIVGVASNGIGY